ncbi:hypothetical protein [Motilibacter aurantiacus]|uniref:hypothetical protein n=1 Tax=Motilibacter aurantiacus TaxID=2714955 RepID=UPI00140ABFDF|nr:hypothetical protein [Motilibacter aurantiacus]NHC46125.1 hypothetical protein [Motilibacter aurantiacus]
MSAEHESGVDPALHGAASPHAATTIGGQGTRISGDEPALGGEAAEPRPTDGSQPAYEGHLPSPDAPTPAQTGGLSPREEIQQAVDIEMGGEQLDDEQRARRAEGERYAAGNAAGESGR